LRHSQLRTTRLRITRRTRSAYLQCLVVSETNSCASYESPCTLVIRFRVCRGVEIITFQAWLSSIERKSAMHGPRDRSFLEESSSVESARLRRGFGIAPVQAWMEMVISKVVTDFKLILSECEMIHEKHSAAKAWFGKRNRHHRPFAAGSTVREQQLLTHSSPPPNQRISLFNTTSLVRYCQWTCKI
jgi:hypothetical protein